MRPADELVILSERLGPVTETEATIERTGARVRGAPLWSAAEIAANAGDATVLILGAVERIGDVELDALPRCHGLVRRGVGYDNVDVDAATRRGVVVANVPDASVEEVSDHALALLLTVERRICELDGAVRTGEWEYDPALIQSLRRGIRRFGGAGLDATEREPLPKNDPMLRSGRIVLTAHSGAWSRTSEADLATRSVAAAVRLIRGERPDSVVNPAVLESPELRNPWLRERHQSTLTTTSGGST